MKKICPTCKREYKEFENYCRKCGIELVKEPNKCSGNKMALCRDMIFEDDDIYCSICGSPTTYWKADLEERKKVVNKPSFGAVFYCRKAGGI